MGTELSPWPRLELVVAEVSVWKGTGTHPINEDDRSLEMTQ